jgi:hypothetical protein
MTQRGAATAPGDGTTVPVPDSAKVRDLIQHRLERALRERVRYRYVRARVLREASGFRIESPCCSRNVDPDGGTIDIALLVPPDARATGQRWSLCARDHARGTWVAQCENESLEYLLDLLCLDSERRFWP